jgi:hypothetical protein
MRGPPVSRHFPRRARLSAHRRRVAATRLRRTAYAPAPCHKGADRQRHSDSASPLPEPRRRLALPRARPSRPRRLPCPKPTTSLSERATAANSSTVSGAPSTPLAAFSPGTLEPELSLPLHSDAVPAGHRSPHLIGERRRRPGLSALPVDKKLR